MENQTKNATIPEHAVSGTVVNDVKGRLKYQSSPFKPKATLLLDILPAEDAKPVARPPGPGLRRDESSSKSEDALQQLLVSTEASAQRTQFAKRRWQLASLVLVMMLTAAVTVVGLLYVETYATGTPRGRLQVKNQSIKEQLNAANVQITELKGQVDTLLNRNTELVSENAQLIAQRQTGAAAGASNTVAVVGQAVDAGRVEAIRKGTYPSGTTKAELIAALGEPDRVYKSDKYEQLVYFGRKPGRFWLAGRWLIRAAE